MQFFSIRNQKLWSLEVIASFNIMELVKGYFLWWLHETGVEHKCYFFYFFHQKKKKKEKIDKDINKQTNKKKTFSL